MYLALNATTGEMIAVKRPVIFDCRVDKHANCFPMIPSGEAHNHMLMGDDLTEEDLEKYESEMELALYREYRDVVGLFSHVVETERRFYLCNTVDVKVRSDGGEVYFDVTMQDAWVWDIYRPARFAKNVRVVTFKDVNVEELAKSELEMPKGPDF